MTSRRKTVGVWVGSLALLGFILNGIFNPVSEEAPKKAESRDADIVAKVPQKIAESPIAQKLRGMSGVDAYKAGLKDGLQDVKEVATATKWTRDNYRTRLDQLTKLQDSLFAVMETAAKDLDSSVIRDYKRGWNEGANSFVP